MLETVKRRDLDCSLIRVLVILFSDCVAQLIITRVITFDQSVFEKIIRENFDDNGISKRQNMIETISWVKKDMKNTPFCLSAYSLSQYHLVRLCGRADAMHAVRTRAEISRIPKMPKSLIEKYFGSENNGISINPTIFTAILPSP
jgi:hypothetical protein